MTDAARLAAAISFLLAGLAAPSSAQGARPMTIAGLGTVTFPVTTRSAAAESAFVRGVLLLHVFEYDDAAAAFRRAERLDSGLALAYWGEAMTHDHPVWDEEDVPAARAALLRYAPDAAAREARAPTPRERGFLHAVDLLFGDGPKARRDTLYSQAMVSLLAANPSDDEARAFFALSLLGLSQGVRNVPTYLRAAGIAESVFRRNPDHPGAAHYWIHGMDDPAHAARALPAARALSQIAPDAGHAQHMTSHIFMALGMWHDVVRANLDARRVAGGKSFCGHGNFWLEYGYLQLGDTTHAGELMRGCRARAAGSTVDAADPDNSPLGSAVEMWARYVIDTKAWSGGDARWAPALPAGAWSRATWEFICGLAAAGRSDAAGFGVARAGFDRSRALLEKWIVEQPYDPENEESRKRLDVLGLELEGLGERLAGRSDSTVTLLRRATMVEDSMAFAFGPPDVDEPSHELLGQVLLALGRWAEAQGEYEAALRKAPGRVSALAGLARAHEHAVRGSGLR